MQIRVFRAPGPTGPARGRADDGAGS